MPTIQNQAAIPQTTVPQLLVGETKLAKLEDQAINKFAPQSIEQTAAKVGAHAAKGATFAFGGYLATKAGMGLASAAGIGTVGKVALLGAGIAAAPVAVPAMAAGAAAGGALLVGGAALGIKTLIERARGKEEAEKPPLSVEDFEEMEIAPEAVEDAQVAAAEPEVNADAVEDQD